MTKKHFEALAAALREQRSRAGDDWRMVDESACVIANVCARFNPNFDRARFLKACGVMESN